MILTKELDEYLKVNIEGYCKAYSLKEDGDFYRVDYIKITQTGNKPVDYSYGSTYLNLKQFKRDSIINETLKSPLLDYDLDVEKIIYTTEQLEKIKRLRDERKDISVSYYNNKVIRLKRDYSESFSVGQRVWYKGYTGIVTFKHFTKKKKSWDYKVGKYYDIDDIARYSIKVKNIEYRYVYGTSLLNRVPEKINIDIDKELDKLSTERLLAMYKAKRKRNKGIGDINIKAILNQREHIQKGETIIK